MTKKCLDEGLLQAYLDGELSPEVSREAASHIARCEACTKALASARNESAFIAEAFSLDDSIVVPTERLRSRINAAVARLETTETIRGKGGAWNLRALLTSVSELLTFTPQSAVAFTALVAVVILATVFALIVRRPGQPVGLQNAPEQVATVGTHPSPGSGTAVEKVLPGSGDVLPVISGDRPSEARIVKVAARRTNRNAVSRVGVRSSVPAAVPELKELLSSEKHYQDSIASMTKTIEMGGDVVLRPAVRADYERNLAVLDRAIAETRGVALRNPKDKDAVNFLLSAYQSKVELLTTVADQAQVATLGR